MEIVIFIIGILSFVYTIIIHEVAHGWVADRLGDPTARLSKRLTLNPVPHIDVYGSLLLPLFLILVRSPFLFGWARPVPIDPYNLKNPQKDTAAIALAGPLSNMLIATILAIIYRFVVFQPASGLILEIIQFNVALAMFNLLPIHPLDGSKIVAGLLPFKESREYENFMNRYGVMLLMFSIFPVIGGVSLVSYVLYPLIGFVLNLLVPGFGQI